MKRVGLTGGMGSGKSSVARRLAAHGAVIIDADEISREVVAPGSDALAEIVERFGADVVGPDGALDRSLLAERAFVDDASREALNAIVHPRVGKRTAELFADAERRDQSRGAGQPEVVAVYDMPLLVETGLAASFPTVIVVLADEDTRLDRLEEQRGVDREDARRRIASQATDAERRDAATHVIDNSGSLDDLHAQVDAVWESIRHTESPEGDSPRSEGIED